MKKSNLYLAIFIVFIMVTSAIGFIYSPSEQNNLNENSLDYKGFNFQLTTDNRFVTGINGNQIVLDNNPNNLDNITLPIFQLTQNKVYFIFNPGEKDNSLEYSMSKLAYMLQIKGVRAVLACSKEENCPAELPIKNCDSESFYFKKSNLTNIYKDNKCIVLEGDNLNINKYVDKIDLALVGAL
jgi:hypothetical protein